MLVVSVTNFDAEKESLILEKLTEGSLMQKLEELE